MDLCSFFSFTIKHWGLLGLREKKHDGCAQPATYCTISTMRGHIAERKVKEGQIAEPGDILVDWTAMEGSIIHSGGVGEQKYI